MDIGIVKFHYIYMEQTYYNIYIQWQHDEVQDVV